MFSNCFADDTSLFLVVNNIHVSATTLSNDLSQLSNLGFNWKIIFNSDSTKHARQVIAGKLNHVSCSKIFKYRNYVSETSLVNTKCKVNFLKHVKMSLKKLARLWANCLPTSSLPTTYKTFIRSQLDYTDISFLKKTEFHQHSACVAIPGATRGMSSEKYTKKTGLRISKILVGIMLETSNLACK